MEKLDPITWHSTEIPHFTHSEMGEFKKDKPPHNKTNKNPHNHHTQKNPYNQKLKTSSINHYPVFLNTGQTDILLATGGVKKKKKINKREEGFFFPPT